MSTPRKVVQYVSNNTSAQQPCKPLRAKFIKAKQQRIRRHEKEFWKEVDNRLDEIMKRYNLIDNDVIDDDIVSPDKLPKF